MNTENPTPPDLNTELERARAAVRRLEAGAALTYDELDAAVDLFATNQHQLLTRHAQLQEKGATAEEIQAAAAAYEKAVLESQPVMERMEEIEDAVDYDPGDYAQHDAYIEYLTEEEPYIDREPDMDEGPSYGLELDIE